MSDAHALRTTRAHANVPKWQLFATRWVRKKSERESKMRLVNTNIYRGKHHSAAVNSPVFVVLCTFYVQEKDDAKLPHRERRAKRLFFFSEKHWSLFFFRLKWLLPYVRVNFRSGKILWYFENSRNLFFAIYRIVCALTLFKIFCFWIVPEWCWPAENWIS